MDHVKIAAYQATLRHYGLLKAALSLTDPRVIGGAVGTVGGGLGGYFTAPKDATTKQKMMRAAGGGALGGASGVAVGHGVHWLRNRPVYRLDQPPAWEPSSGRKPTDEESKKYWAWDKGTAKERALVEAKAAAALAKRHGEYLAKVPGLIDQHYQDALNFQLGMEKYRREVSKADGAEFLKGIPNYKEVRSTPWAITHVDHYGPEYLLNESKGLHDKVEAKIVEHLQGLGLKSNPGRGFVMSMASDSPQSVLTQHALDKAQKEAARIWDTYKPK